MLLPNSWPEAEQTTATLSLPTAIEVFAVEALLPSSMADIRFTSYKIIEEFLPEAAA